MGRSLLILLFNPHLILLLYPPILPHPLANRPLILRIFGLKILLHLLLINIISKPMIAFTFTLAFTLIFTFSLLLLDFQPCRVTERGEIFIALVEVWVIVEKIAQQSVYFCGHARSGILAQQHF